MTDDCVKQNDLDWLQDQIYTLHEEIRTLQMEITLLRNDLSEVKHEGCAVSKNILMRFTDDGK